MPSVLRSTGLKSRTSRLRICLRVEDIYYNKIGRNSFPGEMLASRENQNIYIFFQRKGSNQNLLEEQLMDQRSAELILFKKISRAPAFSSTLIVHFVSCMCINRITRTGRYNNVALSLNVFPEIWSYVNHSGNRPHFKGYSSTSYYLTYYLS